MCEYEYWSWNCGYTVERFITKGYQEQRCLKYLKDAKSPSMYLKAKCIKRIIDDNHCLECKIRLRRARRHGWLCSVCGKVNKGNDRQCKRGPFICKINLNADSAQNMRASRHDHANVLWVPQNEDEICHGTNQWENLKKAGLLALRDKYVVKKCECIKVMSVEFACLEKDVRWEVAEGQEKWTFIKLKEIHHTVRARLG